jgi:hypothetical protein
MSVNAARHGRGYAKRLGHPALIVVQLVGDPAIAYAERQLDRAMLVACGCPAKLTEMTDPVANRRRDKNSSQL